MAGEKKPKMSSALMSMKFMRQGESVSKEVNEKKKQRELEDSSKWSLRRPNSAISTSSLVTANNSIKFGADGTATKKNKKKDLLKRIQSVSYDEIYREGSTKIQKKDTEESIPGRHRYGSFAKNPEEEREKKVREELENEENTGAEDALESLRQDKGNSRKRQNPAFDDDDRSVKRRDFNVLKGLSSISGSGGSSGKKSSNKGGFKRY